MQEGIMAFVPFSIGKGLTHRCALAALLLTAIVSDARAQQALPAEQSEWLKIAKDNPFVVIRWVFNYIFTPVAVISVFTIMIFNILKLIAKGFRDDNLEGYPRLG